MSYTNDNKNWQERGVTYQIQPIKKIPWWIVYPVLLIFGSFLVFIIYRGYIKSDSKETYAVEHKSTVNMTQDNQLEENLGANIEKKYIDVSEQADENISINESENENVEIDNININETNVKVQYVTQEFNVREGPGTQYTKLYTVSINEEIEVLEETDNWARIRIKENGIVGYTILKAYSSERSYYIENVPFLNQMTLGYPMGCEAVSATMAAKYEGYNVSVETIIENTPTDELGKRQETITKEVVNKVLNEETGEIENIITTEEETVWVAENPFKYFVGHPAKTKYQGSYGCYSEPIITALQASGISCTNISGGSVDTLYDHIRIGKPVVVWCRENAQDLTEGVTWQYPDGSGEYVELVGEHCAVLIGYDENYVYLNDPAVGKGVKQDKEKFESNWYKLHSQALIIN